jgi:undecaprenyl pyrophosphate synthase
VEGGVEDHCQPAGRRRLVASATAEGHACSVTMAESLVVVASRLRWAIISLSQFSTRNTKTVRIQPPNPTSKRNIPVWSS